MIRNKLNDRNSEIEKLIRLIDASERASSGIMSGYSDVRIDLKAAVIVMLYNQIESIITDVLTKIHDTALNGVYRYSQLSFELKKIIERYFFSKIKKENDGNVMETLACHSEVISDRKCVELQFKTMSESTQLFSGNLDSKEIKRIMNIYGIHLINGCTELQTIKKYRNQLAHGEASFEEVGRQFTNQQLANMRIKVFQFLSEVIRNMEEFIENTKYLKDERE